MKSTCAFKIIEGRLNLHVTGFNEPIFSFFQLQLQNFMSPRSTTPYTTFEFASYDSNNEQKNVLDFQNSNIEARATQYQQLNTLKLASSSEIVADENQTLRVTLESELNFRRSDGLTLTVPKWNPKAGPAAESFFQSQITCEMVLGPIAPSNCYLEEGEQFDTVVIPSFQVSVPPGATISFTVGPFKNPISTQIQFGFTLLVRDQYQGVSLQNEGFLEITLPKILPGQDSTIIVSDTLVTNKVEIELSINFPVPLEEGCSIEIIVPNQLLIGKQLSTIELGGMFGFGMEEKKFTFEAHKRQIFIQNAVYEYTPNTGAGIIKIFSMHNPGYVIDIDSFKVTFYSSDNHPIIVANAGMTYSTTPGTIEVGVWTAQNYFVSSSQEITMRFAPRHEASEHTKIVVTLPKQDLTVPQTCLIQDYNFLVNSQGMDCSSNVAQNSIAFKDLIFDSYKYRPDDKFIEVTVQDVIMPSSIRPTGLFKIDFYDLVGDTYRLVDTSDFTNLIQADSGELGQVSIKARQDSTWQLDTISFSFLATHEILKGGWIEVVVPAEMKLQDNSVCINLFNLEAQCQFVGQNTFRIVNGFNSQGSKAQFMVTFQVTNVQTQRTTKPSSVFKIRTLDSNGYNIDTHKTFQMTPKAVKPLHDFTLEQTNIVVGGESSILISFKSPIPLINQDSLIMTFPSEELAQQLAVTYQSCQGTKMLKSNINCDLSELNTLIVPLEFDQIDQVGPNTWIQFQINNVANPTSTKRSKPILLKIEDQYGFDIIEMTQTNTEQKKNFSLKASTPADLIFASVAVESSVAFATTLFTFKIITKFPLPPNSNIRIVIPPQIGTIKEKIGCWINLKPEKNTKCELNDKTITLFNINDRNIVGGTTVQFEIAGLVNSKSSEPTGSFIVTTLTNEFEQIDNVSSGLEVRSSCNYPCNQCPLGQPSVCRKCTTTPESLFPLYYDGKCVASCPSHFYAFNQVCSECHSGCLECTGSSKQCTKCAAGFYLLGTVCMDQCPDNYHSNDETRNCDPCKLPCETCSLSTTHCTSCNQQQPLKFFFQNKCYDSCPVGPSVFSQGQCLACTPDCLTCADSFDSCRTCRPEKQSFLDFNTYRCVEKCPALISVPKINKPETKLPQLKTCEKCDVKCKHCEADNKYQCTKCALGLKFNQEDRQCIQSCPPKTAELYIPLTDDFICKKCKPGCAECQYQSDQCSSCDPGLVFFQYDCLTECPEGFKTISDTELVCVRDQEVCDYGYAHNSTGQCDLEVPHCETGYILNSKDDLCIPEPGAHAPGVFIALSAAWVTAVIVMKMKYYRDMSTSTMVNQLLIGFVTIQQIGYYIMFCLSFQLNYSFVVLLHLIGFLVGLIINAVAVIYSLIQLPKDLPFKYWKDKNLKVNYIIYAASMAISFKLLRGLICGIMKQDCLLAVFQDKIRNFSRPIMIMTGVSFLLQVAPIAYVNIYVFIQIPYWGYEIRTLGIESLILACVIIALEIYDYILQTKGEKELPKISQLMLNPKSKKQVTFNVMAGFDDGNDQQNLIKVSDPTCQSQIDLLENLNRQIIEKKKHKEMQVRFDDKILDEDTALFTVKQKKEYIFEKRQNFEVHRLEPRKNYERVAHIQVGDQIIDEPNDEVIDLVGKNFKKIQPAEWVDSAIDFYEYRTEEEMERDVKEFKIHFEECDAKIKHEQKKRHRLGESFDDEYLRELYDDFGVCSDFESQQSWISYPPQEPRIMKDAYLMAQASLLSEKIKWKFMYNNVGSDQHPIKHIVPKLDLNSRKTQTWAKTIDSDPFESSQDSIIQCSSRELSVVDSKIAKRIFLDVLDGQTDSNYLNSLNSARSRQSKVKVSIDSNNTNIVAIGSSKKRPRRQTNFLQKDDQSDNSQFEAQKQHIQPLQINGTLNIEFEANEDEYEEQQIENEIQRLQNNRSMELASEKNKKSKVSYKSKSEEEDAQNFQIGTIRMLKLGGKKKRRDRIMYRAYQPDDGQLTYLNCHYLDQRKSVSVRNKKVPAKTESSEKIKDPINSEYVSSAVDTATEGANLIGQQSAEPNQQKDNLTHTPWDESVFDDQKVNLHSVGMASTRTFNIESSVKKEPKKIFNKFEHGYLFNFQQKVVEKKMINGVEYQAPLPFRKTTDQPFKSTKTKMLEMERGNSQTVGFDKLMELEQLYLRPPNPGNNVNITRMSQQVYNDNLVKKGNQKRPSTADVNRGVSFMQRRDLRKQNFMEDGKQLIRQGSVGVRGQQTVASMQESQPEGPSLQNELKLVLERMSAIRKLEQKRHQQSESK